MSSFAFSPIRGRPKNSDETSEETKAPARKGSPTPTATEQYAMYAGDPEHPYNLKKDTIDKIFKECDMMKEEEQRKTFYNELLGIKVKIGLVNNDYEKLKKKGNKEQQLKLFDDFLNTQLNILCKEGETYYNTFYTQLNLLLYGEKFAQAFATIPFNRGKQGGSKTRKKCRRFRNNLRKNKISRKYIMLKQCGGGKAKMGAKSKPYSSKRKAMKSRRRVCYYKKKGRTLKLKKKKKSRGRKKSRRRR